MHAASSGYDPPGGVVALQRESRTMELAGYQPASELNLTGQGKPWHLRGLAISANLFHTLGVSVQAGQSFHAGEDEAGQDNVVILSDELLQDRFAGDLRIVGGSSCWAASAAKSSAWRGSASPSPMQARASGFRRISTRAT